MRKIIFLLTIIISSFFSAKSLSITYPKDTLDYKSIYYKEYTTALEFLVKESWIYDTIAKYSAPIRFTIAIIFPELMRYSFWRDQLESQSLKVLYVQYGEEYANFSIGYFQMKPVFVKELERLCAKSKQPTIKKIINNKVFDLSETPQARKERVLRMMNIYWQIRYVCLFYHWLNSTYINYPWKSDVEKLRFFATAYNTGKLNLKNVEDIEYAYNQKTYYTGLIKPTVSYNYAAISCYYFQKK